MTSDTYFSSRRPVQGVPAWRRLGAVLFLALFVAGPGPGLAEPESGTSVATADAAPEPAEDRQGLQPSADSGEFLQRHVMLLALGFGLAGAGLGIVLLMLRNKDQT